MLKGGGGDFCLRGDIFCYREAHLGSNLYGSEILDVFFGKNEFLQMAPPNVFVVFERLQAYFPKMLAPPC